MAKMYYAILSGCPYVPSPYFIQHDRELFFAVQSKPPVAIYCLIYERLTTLINNSRNGAASVFVMGVNFFG